MTIFPVYALKDFQKQELFHAFTANAAIDFAMSQNAYVGVQREAK